MDDVVLPAMKPNPGGGSKAYSEDAVGRDELADRCWRILDVKSLVLLSDRRMGKTWLLKKMGEEARDHVIWVYCEVEGTRTVGQLLDCVHDAAGAHLHFKARALAKTSELIQAMAGKSVASFTVPALQEIWKKGFTTIFGDLTENSPDRMVVLVLDEFPLLLHKLFVDQPTDAMELCDMLRHLRQKHAGLRMVLAGSVGLHLVMEELYKAGYGNDPFNDTEPVEVPPLEGKWARELAGRLLRGAEISDPNGETAKAIAEAAEGIPYYIQRLPFEMERSPEKGWRAGDVPILLRQLIEAPTDPLNLGHYRQRIETYFPDRKERDTVCGLLDELAAHPGGVGLADLFDALCAAHPDVPRPRIAALAEMLERDHYLKRNPEGTYSFSSGILRHWWCFRREGVRNP